MKTRASSGALVLVLVLLGGIAAWRCARGDRAAAPAPPAAVASPPAPPARAPAPAHPAAPGRARATPDDDSGVIDGRVLDAVTHEGVPDAELTLFGDTGVATFKTSSDGTFELTPTVTGSFVLSAITAPGYLPYTPGAGYGGMRVRLARGRSVHGITLLLSPAVDYQGLVEDARGAPVAGARVRVVRGPAAPGTEAAAAEWRSGADGRFTFQAAEDAVLEASRGTLRGWARVDHHVTIAKQLTVRLGGAPHDATITGHVRDAGGAPIADAVVRATPSYTPTATAFAASGPDGAFTLTGLDRAAYDVSAEAEDRVRAGVVGGSRDVELTLDAGLLLAGHVVDGSDGAPIVPLGIDGAIARLRGVLGTAVALTVQRGGRELQFVIVRRLIRS